MISQYYFVLFLASLVATVLFIANWHKHVDVYYTLIFTFIPISNMGWWLVATAESLQEAIMANQIIYMGGCFIPLIFALNTLTLCEVPFPKLIPLGHLVIGIIQYLFVLTIGSGPVYYKSVEFAIIDGTPTLLKVYGPAHVLMYINLGLCILSGLYGLIYAHKYQKKVSRQNIFWLVSAELVMIVGFILTKVLSLPVDLTPFFYVVSQVLFLILTKRLCLYDISETVVDNIVTIGRYGLLSVDKKKRFLGCNDTALAYIPELEQVLVDQKLPEGEAVFEMLKQWFAQLDEMTAEKYPRKEMNWERDGKSFRCSVEYLYHGRKREGYQLIMIDDTQQQHYITLLNHYNEDLQREVARQTEHIEMMQQRVVLGMADMVESRDFSTGGHIKRTSHVVRILVKELQKAETFPVSEGFYSNVIKAAPLHDLGKMAIDDAILRKPGSFTDEEFDSMKHHAARGAELIDKVLDGIDDEEFQVIAENVAHYHHEKWDGTGYPDHLKGEEIPLEARIMAVADVCDALISKRYYKEGMSPQKAFVIIEGSMGTQFDPALKQVFMNAEKEIAQYYTQKI